MTRFHGVIVPMVTLFRSDGAIDWEANGRLIDDLISCGVHGLFVLGSTGEAVHLTVAEREAMIRFAVERARGRVPLLAGVGDPSTSTACSLARTARDAGADGVVALGPFFWRLDERHLHAYFRAVAEATDLPVLLYNYPALVGANLSVELVRTLADECPNIAGIKETLDSGTHMRAMIHHVKRGREAFSVFCGHDDLALFALTAGADGMVSSTANFAPELFVSLYQSYRNGEFAAAVAASAAIGRLVEAYQADPCGAAVVKTALRLRGRIESPDPRPPALPLDPAATDRIRRLLQETRLMGENE